jgi:hypothetical protein
MKKEFGTGPESRDQFYHVVREMIPSIQRDHILCGLDTNGIKTETLSKHPVLQKMYENIM